MCVYVSVFYFSIQNNFINGVDDGFWDLKKHTHLKIKRVQQRKKAVFFYYKQREGEREREMRNWETYFKFLTH